MISFEFYHECVIFDQFYLLLDLVYNKKVFFMVCNIGDNVLRQQHFDIYPICLAPPKISSHEELGLVSPHTIP